jgi:hypothetical protein
MTTEELLTKVNLITNTMKEILQDQDSESKFTAVLTAETAKNIKTIPEDKQVEHLVELVRYHAFLSMLMAYQKTGKHYRDLVDNRLESLKKPAQATNDLFNQLFKHANSEVQ